MVKNELALDKIGPFLIVFLTAFLVSTFSSGCLRLQAYADPSVMDV